ncbi:hypothetical protein MF271_18940 (plasmid) [Deinococcus sp. KNUC1210]|uniref:hypothetical protein n=1 Tax=Deinococcus sp. KNUC1210 TaxID=2917691 RepID=UPI001EF02E8D|nr:hypothetical protein [Deinococcus sp. KNUC1210]ULH17398.1 hypothetical protein MF271_18940 [Deinococcus sp. KNUC1210]
MTNLDGSAIIEIERLVNEADVVLAPTGEQKGVYYLRQPDGSYQRQRAELDPANVQLYDLESLGREVNGKDEHLTVVYVSDSEVTALFDDTHTRWTAKVLLPLHPMFALLSTFKKPAAYDQKGLVRLLRTELSAAVPQSVIDQLASLRFTNNSDTLATVRPMAAGLDRNIHKQVQGENGTAAPDFLDLTVPVFDIREARADQYPVRVFLDYDHDKSVFILVVRHDDLRMAQEAAVGKIIAALEQDERLPVTVAYGTPALR